MTDRGERQKPITDAYRDGWDRIFGKKKPLKPESKTQYKRLKAQGAITPDKINEYDEY